MAALFGHNFDRALLLMVRDASDHAADHEQFIEHLHSLDEAAVVSGLRPVVVITTELDTPAPDARWRQRYTRARLLTRSRRGFLALVTRSVVQRGVLWAMQWVTPSSPVEVVAVPDFQQAVTHACGFRGTPLPELVALFEEAMRRRDPATAR